MTIKLNSINTFVISLPHETLRRKAIRKKLIGVCEKFEFFDAINAREYKALSEEFVLKGELINNKNSQKIKLKTNHCCLTHCQSLNL